MQALNEDDITMMTAANTEEAVPDRTTIESNDEDDLEKELGVNKELDNGKEEECDEVEEEELPDFSQLLISREHTMAIRGLKLAEPDNSGEHLSKLQESMDAYFLVLSEERRVHRTSIIEAVWINDIRMAEVIQPNGVHFQSTGRISVKGRLRLYPEETLYLMERGVISLRVGAGIVSLQQAYLILLDEWCTLEKCQAYMYLKRLGYYVFRHGLSNYPEEAPTPSFESKKETNPANTISLWSPLYRMMSFFVSQLLWWRKPLKRNIRVSLVNALDYASFDEIYKQLQVVPKPLIETPRRYTWALDFDAFKPRPHFKKTSPGAPWFSFVVITASEKVPLPGELSHLQSQAPNVSVKLVVVDGANISFLSLSLQSPFP